MISGLQRTWLKKTKNNNVRNKCALKVGLNFEWEIRKLTSDSRQFLFPERLGSALILYATRSNDTFMSTSIKVIRRLGTGVDFSIRSMGAGRRPFGVLVHIYICMSIFRTFANFSLRTQHCCSVKHQILVHMKPGRTRWSRSRRDPCTLERVAGAKTFLFRQEWIRRFP